MLLSNKPRKMYVSNAKLPTASDRITISKTASGDFDC